MPPQARSQGGEVEGSALLNEIDYDQGATDASEFIELYIANVPQQGLGDLEIALVNGTTGSVYRTIEVREAQLQPDSYYVVCADATVVIPCHTDIAPDTDWIRDGDGGPDAVVLRRGGMVLDVVSYNGASPAPYTEGSAGAPPEDGLVGHGLARIPNRSDTDDNAFDWSPATITPGEANVVSVCGNGFVDLGEDCDAGTANGTVQSCCSASCEYMLPDTICGPGTEQCQADACNATGACIPNAHNEPLGAICGLGTDECRADACDGAGACVPNSTNATNGTACADNGLWCDGLNSCLDGVCVDQADPCRATGYGAGCIESVDSCKTVRLPFSQDWSDPDLITVENDWSQVPGIEGFRGHPNNSSFALDSIPQFPPWPPEEVGVLDVYPNQTDPNTFGVGGVAEFEATGPEPSDPTIGLMTYRSDPTFPGAHAPYLRFYLDTRGVRFPNFRIDVRDIEVDSDRIVQVGLSLHLVADPLAMATGSLYYEPPTNLRHHYYVPDATEAGSATRVSRLGLVHPLLGSPRFADRELVIFRVHAATTGLLSVNDINNEWVGIDNIHAGFCGDGNLDLASDFSFSVGAEACDLGAENGKPGSCCDLNCRIVGAGVLCRDAAGLCDVPELCDGVSPGCPADVLIESDNVCRQAVDVCDVAELCDGSSAQCPADALLGSETQCNAANGPCDAADFCNGVVTSCPDAYAGATVECRPGGPEGECNPAELCTGASPECPPDVLSPAGTVCRPGAGVCDAPEACSGSSATCPPDAFLPASQECRGSAGICDLADHCSGAGVSCPADAFDVGATCRSAIGSCDTAELCVHGNPDCPSDLLRPSGTECRASSDAECDPAESCSGDSPHCPTDELTPDETTCFDDGQFCTGAEQCQGGDCISPGDPCMVGERCFEPDVCESPATALLINEINYRDATREAEFVEVYNPNGNAIHLEGYSLLFVDPGDTTYRTHPLSGVVSPGDYWVLCTSAAAAGCDEVADFDIHDGPGAAVAIQGLPGFGILDSVAYDGDGPFAFTETAGATADAADLDGFGLSRTPDGTDTNQNFNDFQRQCLTPGSVNSADPGDCTVCGNGIVDGGSLEQCDDAGSNGAATSCCTEDCQLRSPAATCRPSMGVCDPAEQCTGDSGVCPADALAPGTELCRPDAGECDLDG